MASFEIAKKIGSCHITKEVLSQLETYILNIIPELTNISRSQLSKEFTIAIKDKMGTQEVPNISEYRLSYFPDTTKSIKIHFRAFGSSGERIWVNIDLMKYGEFTELTINFTGDNPRETVIGMYNSIKEIIELKKNKNRIFNLGPVIDYGLVPILSIYSISIAIKAFKLSKYNGGFLFTFIFLFFISYYFGKVLKPYITFESNRYYSVKKWSDLLIWGLISFIIFGIIANTIWLLIRKQFLGF